MKELVLLFAVAGAQNVRTYIQSGNVVFDAPAGTAARIAASVTSAIDAHLGFCVPVVLRTAEQVAAVIAANPFVDPITGDLVSTDPKLIHVAFLADTPAADRLARLDAQRFVPDEFVLRGDHLYLHYPNGSARSKMTNAYFDRTLGTTTTARNWRSVNAILALAKS